MEVEKTSRHLAYNKVQNLVPIFFIAENNKEIIKKKNPRIYKGTGIAAFQVLTIMGVKLFSQK